MVSSVTLEELVEFEEMQSGPYIDSKNHVHRNVQISSDVALIDHLPDTTDLLNLNLGFVPTPDAALGARLPTITGPSVPLTLGLDAMSAATGPVSRSRPRARKNTPVVVTEVRRSPRFANNGFMHTAMPDQSPRRHSSSVPRASTPRIMQIEEMQRIGVEDCGIDPEELTMERLHQKRRA